MPVRHLNTSPFDAELLAEAASQLCTHLGLDCDPGAVRWSVASGPEQRRTATVFELVASLPGNRSERVFYKGFQEPAWNDSRRSGGGNQWAETLERSWTLTRAFNDSGEKLMVRAAPVLTVDTRSSTIITLGVNGRTLESLLRSAALGIRRSQVMAMLNQLGVACRLIDDVANTYPPSGPQGDLTWWVDHYMRTYPIPEEGWSKDIGPRMRSWADETMTTPKPLSYCHGDLQGGNVLMDGHWLNLIDFRWAIRPRGFDLVQTALRLENRPWNGFLPTAGMREALLAGYGDTNMRDTPVWHLVEAMFLLRRLHLRRRNSLRAAQDRARAYERLRALM